MISQIKGKLTVIAGSIRVKIVENKCLQKKSNVSPKRASKLKRETLCIQENMR
jgi:hypothetical protein